MDAYLVAAGSVFLFLWTAIIGAIGVAAFGRDLLPSKAAINISLSRGKRRA